MPGAEQSEHVAGSVLIILNIQFLQIIKCLNFPGLEKSFLKKQGFSRIFKDAADPAGVFQYFTCTMYITQANALHAWFVLIQCQEIPRIFHSFSGQ